jgi:hypothetical protein
MLTSNVWSGAKACEYTVVSFQNLKLNTRDIIVVLMDTLNITSSLLPILDPHVIGVPSNTFVVTLALGSRLR